MKQLITNIRNKPQHHKNRIVLLTLAGVVLMMLILWWIVGPPPRQGASGDVIIDFNEDMNQGQNVMPELFPNENQ